MPASFEISFFQALFERKYLKSIIIQWLLWKKNPILVQQIDILKGIVFRWLLVLSSGCVTNFLCVFCMLCNGPCLKADDVFITGSSISKNIHGKLRSKLVLDLITFKFGDGLDPLGKIKIFYITGNGKNCTIPYNKRAVSIVFTQNQRMKREKGADFARL